MTDRSRRRFIGACGAALTLFGQARVAAPLTVFAPVRLVDEHDQPLTPALLEPEREYVFFYPYLSTPAFLLDLGRPTVATQSLQTADGTPYQWTGGIGPQQSIVAFSAICAHRLSHPAAAVSFIGYRSQPVGFIGPDRTLVRQGAVIQCCSEQSIYDPAHGAQVLAGPAPQPLAAIALNADDGTLSAHGVYGGLLFERFFAEFGFRLELEFGSERFREPVSGTAVVRPLDAYTRQRIQC